MSKNLKKDLQAVSKELKALSKKVEKAVTAVDKLEKAKAVKAKPVRKAAAKPARKVAVKKPAAKKTAQLSAVDTALGFIKRSKKGVSTATLMEKTGFDQKKVYNIIYKLNKLGKIKSDAALKHSWSVNQIGACQCCNESGEGLFMAQLRVGYFGIALPPGNITGQGIISGQPCYRPANDGALGCSHGGGGNLQVHGGGRTAVNYGSTLANDLI